LSDAVYSAADKASGGAGTLGHLWATAVQGLLLRLDLIAVEAKEEKERFLGFLLLGLLVALSAFMAFLVLNLTIVALAGEHRIAVLLVMFGLYSLLTAALGIGMWRKLRSAPAPFAATVEELKKDQALYSGR